MLSLTEKFIEFSGIHLRLSLRPSFLLSITFTVLCYACLLSTSGATTSLKLGVLIPWSRVLLPFYRKNRQVYLVWCSRLHNHTLFIKEQCKKLGVRSNFGEVQTPNSSSVCAHTVYIFVTSNGILVRLLSVVIGQYLYETLCIFYRILQNQVHIIWMRCV